MSENEKHGSGEHSNASGESLKFRFSSLAYFLVALTVLVLAVNQFMLFSIGGRVAGLSVLSAAGAAAPVVSSSTSVPVGASSATGTGPSGGTVSLQQITPTGVPAVYGSELGVSYDEPVAAISKMGKLENSITLSGNDLKRYIGIGLQISCEYCCGAPSIISANGEPGCGCAHSGVMRSLGKYLIKNHPELSDDQILAEMAKWKILFFPKQNLQKAQVLAGAGIPTDPISLASSKYTGSKLKQIASGASASSASAGSSGNLPNMVGGC